MLLHGNPQGHVVTPPTPQAEVVLNGAQVGAGVRQDGARILTFAHPAYPNMVFVVPMDFAAGLKIGEILQQGGRPAAAPDDDTPKPAVMGAA